jgi:hypothetical protein
MTRSRRGGWGVALALVAGCASTVSAGADGAVTDVGVIDLGAIDGGSADVGADVPMDVHGCPPVVDEDVPSADVVASDGPYVVELSIEGDLHQCARMSDGTLRCRGWNAGGQLGLGTITAGEDVPVTVPGVTDVAQVITVVNGVTCTRHGDGSVRCWGNNDQGLLGTGHDGDRPDCRCRPSPTLVPGLTGVIHLSSDWSQVYAVRQDGSVWRWGENVTDRPTATPVPIPTLSDVAMLWPVSNGLVARLRSGRYVTQNVTDFVLHTGDDLTIPSDATINGANPSRVYHLCYRLPDGSVRCVGDNSRGELGDGTTTSRALSDPSDPGLCAVRSISVAFNHSCALMSDRTMQCWGDDVTRPTPVPGLDGVDRVFLGGSGACALRSDRSVWCWGSWSGGLPVSTQPMPVTW